VQEEELKVPQEVGNLEVTKDLAGLVLEPELSSRLAYLLLLALVGLEGAIAGRRFAGVGQSMVLERLLVST